MSGNDLAALAALLKQQRDPLLSSWRRQLRELPSARDLDVPTLNDHIPALLDELGAALEARSEQTIPEALSEGSPPAHGLQRVQDAFDIEEVVAEYNILRGCIHDLADQHGVALQGRPFHVLNRVLDQAIGLALQTYATQRALEVKRRREEYLSFVAHDLRTPLTAISLAGRVLELALQDEARARQEAAQMCRALRRNVKRLEELIAKVLEENANLQAEIGIRLERRELDLWSFVEALFHDVHPVAGTASTQLVNEVPDDLVIYADAGLLGRILQNLVANAIKYTPRGRIAIGARELQAEGAVECWVKDDGAGIPAELLEKIFDKGESDPESTDGLGLGLAIVKTFAEAHGGRVSVESKPGTGALFRVVLPTKATADARSTSQP